MQSKYKNKNWSFYPYIKEKEKFVLNYIKDKKGIKILDVGCGEGYFLKKIKKLGYNIKGIDKEYESDNIEKIDIFKFKTKEKFDIILCLDFIEHLNYKQQEDLLIILRSLLKEDGIIIFSIPSLSSLVSRIRFLLKGEFIRTANIHKHTGDRPIKEYLSLLKDNGYNIMDIKGIIFMQRFHYLKPIIELNPNLCKLIFIVIEKDGI